MAAKKMSLGLIFALAITGLFLTVVSAGVLTVSQSVAASGTVTAVNVGVYLDSACTQACTSVNWGNLSPGNSTTRTVYVKNTGTVPVTLGMSASNWNPTNANTVLSLTWDRNNVVVSPSNSVMATLTLTAAANTGTVSSFTFNIIITGTG